MREKTGFIAGLEDIGIEEIQGTGDIITAGVED